MGLAPVLVLCLVFGHVFGLVLGRVSCEHGEQRVLVAAPRFALYVARNKHPLLAFWLN